MALQFFLAALLWSLITGLILVIIGWTWTGIILLVTPVVIFIWFIFGARL